MFSSTPGRVPFSNVVLSATNDRRRVAAESQRHREEVPHANSVTDRASAPCVKDHPELVLRVVEEVFAAGAGDSTFFGGRTVEMTECNMGSTPQCLGEDFYTAANADGSVTPHAFTLVGASKICLPPSATDISSGVACAMVITDRSGAIPPPSASSVFLDRLTISASLSSGKATVTCKKVGNIGATHETVDFLRNGITMATMSNTNGTVKATFTATAGATVQCKGETFKQKSQTLTL
jgi:hypothetical protein